MSNSSLSQAVSTVTGAANTGMGVAGQGVGAAGQGIGDVTNVADKVSSYAGYFLNAQLIILSVPPETLRFAVNPNDYQIGKETSWMESKQPSRRKGGRSQFQGAKARTLSFQMFMDATGILPNALKVSRDAIGLNGTIKSLLSTCDPTPASLAERKPMPPKVTFSWGINDDPFTGYVQKVDITYKLFRMGLPVRAEATVSMVEDTSALGPTNPTSGGLAARRTHVMVSGDSLASISYGAYSNATLWRAIAEVNGIDDPSRIPVGTELLIPDLSEVEGLA